MTNEEAIQEIKDRVALAEAKGHDKDIPEYVEALRMAIEALEKQIPKKPKAKATLIFGDLHPLYTCPSCDGCGIIDCEGNELDFCEYCGQALLWEGTE